MIRKLLLFSLVASMLCAAQSNTLFSAQTFTASAQTGAVIKLNDGTLSASSFSVGTITLTGTSLTTATFAVMASSDNGVTYFSLPISPVASPGATPTSTVTAVANALYQVNLVGITQIKFVTSGTFTGTSVSLVLTASPNGNISRGSSGGSSFVSVVSPSGDTTGTTDGAAIQAACSSFHSVQLAGSIYYIGHANSTVTFSTDCRVAGVGLATIIQNEGTTNDWFKFNNFTLWHESPWVYPTSTQQNELAWMQFRQDPNVTPTAGHLVVIGSGIAQSGGTFSYTFNVHIHDTVANNVFAGVSLVTDELYASLDHNVWNNFVSSSSGNCINYNAEVGSGDNYFGPDHACSGSAADYGILIAQSDVQHFISSKLNGSGIQFTGAGATKSVIFNDMSVETGVTKPCMIDFGVGSAPINTQFVASEQFGFTTAFCNPSNATGLAFAFNNSSSTTDYAAGLITNNGYATVSFPTAVTYQDFASFAGTVSTPLSSYTTTAPGSGKTFSQYTADGVTPQSMPVLTGSSAEKINGGGNSFGDVLDTLTPATADYTVAETFTLAASTDQVGVFGRANSAANTNYVFVYGGTGFLDLYSQVAGTAVQLAQISFTWSAGATHTLALKMVGSTISAMIDGSNISGSPVTNSAVTAKGQAGSRVYAGATGTGLNIQ